MKVAVTALTLLVTVELVLGIPPPGYGPPQPFPPPQKYRPPNGGPIPAKFPPFAGSHFGKNEFYSKFNPHLLPPGVRLPQSKLPPPFGKYPPPPPPGKYQQYQQQQQQQQQQQHQQQHQQQQPPPHHLPNFKPIGPQFQSKPQLLANLQNQHSQGPQGPHQFGGQDQQRLQSQPQPSPKITNIWTGPKLSGGPPDFPPRFPGVPTTATAAASHVAPATQPPPLEKRRGPYIINSDDERGPIKTIPAPNLNPADKPANFDEQLYRAQHQQSFVQQLDNSITDEKSSYQVTEDPSAYKPLSGQPSYFAPDPDTVQGPKIQSPAIDTADSIPSVGKVPLDVALQQHLDAQHQHQQVPATAESGDKLTAQELYALLNGNGVAPAVVPQTAYMVPQQVMYAVPQPQPLDLQIGQPLQYSPQSVQLQYAQPLTAATATGVDLQYLQPQTVQYQPQPVQYQPQTVQYQPQAVQYQQYLQQQQQPGHYISQQQTAEDTSSYEQEQQQQHDQLQQQEQLQQQQQQQQHHQQHLQQQQDQLQQQQQQQQQPQYTQQQQQQAPETGIQYQQEQELQDYEPRNNKATAAPEQQTLQQPDEENLQQDRGNFESIRSQYYSAVPNEQTAGVLAQIAESAAANQDVVAESSATVASATPAGDQSGYGKPSVEKSATGEQSAAVQMQTSVQIQQSVPLYEGSYASSRRHQEYADDGGVQDELMEGSESVAVSESAAVASVNGHAPSQFPYNAAKINAFAAN